MTTGDVLREWAVRMRSLLEASDATRMTMTLASGAEVEYELGAGLTYRTGDRVLNVPESALDEERWMVPGGAS